MTVHEPATLAALAAVLQSHPGALLVAGGTQVMRTPARHAEGRAVVCLRDVELLSRVSRSQRFLDIGATVPLSRVLSIGPRVVPRVLFSALKATATPTVRVLASLGGNVCAAGVEHTSLTALAVLDASLELRLGAGIRVVPAGLFWRGGNDRALQAGEILARVRLPLEELEFQQFGEEEVSWRGVSARTSFAAVAALHKGSIEELRFCFCSPWFGTLRFGDFESACVGARLPMRERAAGDLLTILKKAVTQRLGAPIPEIAPILSVVLRHARRIVLELSRRGPAGDHWSISGDARSAWAGALWSPASDLDEI
jgi:CO/xanthine dehydrogenase FAD-binding subunit